MANVGSATIQLNLDISAFEAGLKGLAPKLKGALGGLEGSSTPAFGKAGAAAGAAYTAAVAQSVVGFKFNSALQSELSKSASIFKAAGDVGGLAFAGAVGLGGQLAAKRLAEAGTQGSAAFAAAMSSGGSKSAASFANSFQAAGAAVSKTMAAIVSAASVATATGMSLAGQNAGSAFNRSLTQTSGQIANIFTAAANTAGSGAGQALIRSFGATANRNAFFRLGQNMGNGLKSSFDDVGAAIGQRLRYRISNALVGVGAGLLDTKNFGEADKQARRVETLARAPGERQALQRQAQQIAKDLGYAVLSKDISAGQYQVLSSNISDRKQVNALATAGSKFSATTVGEVDSELGIKAVTRIFSILKNTGFDGSGKNPLGAKDSDRVASFLVGLQDATTGYKERVTAQSVGKLIQPASALKLNAYEAGGFAAVASNTLGPERVNAGVEGFYGAIRKPTKQAVVASREIGFDFSAQSLQDKGLIEFIEQLNSKLKDYQKIHGQASRNEKLSQLFGGRQAGSVVGAVIDKVGEVRASADTIKKGDINRSLAISQQGLIAKQLAFKNSLVELDIQIKQGLIGTTLTQAFSAAAGAVKVLGEGLTQLNTWYAGLDSGTKGFIDTISKIGITVAGVVGSIVAFGAAWAIAGGAITAGVALVGSLVTGFATLAIALAPVALPVIALGAAVYGLSKAFGATDFEAFRNTVVAVSVALAAVFGPAAVGAVAAWGAAFVLAGQAATIAVVSAVRAMAVAALTSPLAPFIVAAGVLAGAAFLVYKNWESIKEFFKGFGVDLDGVGRAISIFGSESGDKFESLLSDIKSLLSGNTDAWGKWQRSINISTTSLLSSVGNAFKGQFSTIDNLSGNFWSNFLRRFTGGLGQSTSSAKSWASTQTTLFSSAFNQVISGINQLIRWFRDLMASVGEVGSRFDQLRAVATNTFNLLVSGAQNFVNGTVAAFRPLIEQINSVIGAYQRLINTQSGVKAAPGLGSIPEAGKALSPQSSRGSQGVLVAGDGDIGFAIAAQLLAKRPQSASGGTATVGASVYYPGSRDINGRRIGEGDIEGREIGSRNNKITSRDAVVAIPAEKVKGINQIPFGTILEITNKLTGLSTEARVADAGPFKPGRSLDITQAVAEAIGFKGTGQLDVKILKLPPGVDPNQTFYFGEATRFGGGSKVLPGPSISGVSSPAARSTAQSSGGSFEDAKQEAYRQYKAAGGREYPGGLSTLHDGKSPVRIELGSDYYKYHNTLAKLIESGRFSGGKFGASNGSSTSDPGGSAPASDSYGFVSPFPGVDEETFRNRRPRPYQEFGAGRFRGSGKRRKLVPGAHGGDDFEAPAGTPVQSSYSGTARVIDYQQKGASYDGGVAVVVRFVDSEGRKITNTRGHLDEESVFQTLGKKPGSDDFEIKAGQIIGKVKKLGLREKDHVHDEIRVGGGKPISAREYLLSGKGANGDPLAAGKKPGKQLDEDFSALQSKISKINSDAALAVSRIEAKVANGSLSPADSERQKNAVTQQRYDSLLRLQPEIAKLKQQYGQVAEAQERINQLDRELVDSSTDVSNSVIGLWKAQADAFRKPYEAIVNDDQRQRDEVGNALISKAISEQEAAKQLAAIQQNTAAKLEKLRADAIRFKATRAPEDTEGLSVADVELSRISRLSAETTGATYTRDIEGFRSNIDNLQKRQLDRSTEIKYKRQVGDIDANKEKAELLALQLSTNEELQKAVPLLEAYRAKQINPDVIKSADDLLIKLLEINGAAREAQTIYDRDNAAAKVQELATRAAQIATATVRKEQGTREFQASRIDHRTRKRGAGSLSAPIAIPTA
jgi:hypothetical protein